jgi:hypothetical protein
MQIIRGGNWSLKAVMFSEKLNREFQFVREIPTSVRYCYINTFCCSLLLLITFVRGEEVNVSFLHFELSLLVKFLRATSSLTLRMPQSIFLL